MTHVTCRLTAKNRDQLRNPTLGNRLWATLLVNRGKHGFHTAAYTQTRPPGAVSNRGRSLLSTIALFAVVFSRSWTTTSPSRVSPSTPSSSLARRRHLVHRTTRAAYTERTRDKTGASIDKTNYSTQYLLSSLLFVTDTVLCRATMLQNCTQNNLFHTTSILIFVLCSS